MPDDMFSQTDMRQGRFIPAGGKVAGGLALVIDLDVFNPAGECPDRVLHKHGGGIRAVFLEGASTYRHLEYSSMVVYWKNFCQ